MPEMWKQTAPVREVLVYFESVPDSVCSLPDPATGGPAGVYLDGVTCPYRGGDCSMALLGWQDRVPKGGTGLFSRRGGDPLLHGLCSSLSRLQAHVSSRRRQPLRRSDRMSMRHSHNQGGIEAAKPRGQQGAIPSPDRAGCDGP